MTTGQMVFYAGAALLALTFILAIVFLIVKPKYRPENAAAGYDGKTAPLRNGYPTQPITVRREAPVSKAVVPPAPVVPAHRFPAAETPAPQSPPAAPVPPVIPAGETMVLCDEADYIPGTTVPPAGETVLLADETVVLADETVVLADETVVLADETVVLADETVVLTDDTQPLSNETVLL